jgi:NitT/TauT family transport system ATP-binding protein
MPLVDVRDLHKRFRRDGIAVHALDRITLAVVEGEFVTIVGPSGCGKTTFLHMLGGFEPVEEGAILLDGRPVTAPGPDRGVVFQEFALFPWRSVLGNVVWPLEIKGMAKNERIAVAERYLDLVHLRAFRDHYPSELSGGMKQRVALARVLVLDPRILLMDEPFGALDAQTRELMQEELLDIWGETRKTVIFITHDIDEAVYLSDRIVILTARPGRVKEELTVDLPRPRRLEIKKSPRYAALRNRVWDSLHEEVLDARRDRPERAL